MVKQADQINTKEKVENCSWKAVSTISRNIVAKLLHYLDLDALSHYL